jgi:hypothetical protein
MRRPTNIEGLLGRAVHEAAHGVLGHSRGREVDWVTLETVREQWGCCSFDAAAESAFCERDFDSWLEACWHSTLAGGIALRYFASLHGFCCDDGLDGFGERTGPRDDSVAARQIALHVRRELPSIADVEREVLGHWPEITRVAVALARAGTLDRAGFLQALEGPQAMSPTEWLRHAATFAA